MRVENDLSWSLETSPSLSSSDWLSGFIYSLNLFDEIHDVERSENIFRE